MKKRNNSCTNDSIFININAYKTGISATSNDKIFYLLNNSFVTYNTSININYIIEITSVYRDTCSCREIDGMSKYKSFNLFKITLINSEKIYLPEPEYKKFKNIINNG